MSWLAPLVEEVTHYWAKTGKAYNLAKAKPELSRRQVPVDTHLAGRKLKDAILEDAATELRLVRNPESKLSWGLVPASADTPANLAELFADVPKSPQAPDDPIRFSRGVWLAFSKPLKVGCRRFLEVRKSRSASLHEVYEGQPLPSSGVEILPNYIWNSNGELIPSENRDQEIDQTIRRWAQEKDIPLDFLKRKDMDQDGFESEQGASYLDISGLTQSDKARILIPLDLLEKIRFGK